MLLENSNTTENVYSNSTEVRKLMQKKHRYRLNHSDVNKIIKPEKKQKNQIFKVKNYDASATTAVFETLKPSAERNATSTVTSANDIISALTIKLATPEEREHAVSKPST